MAIAAVDLTCTIVVCVAGVVAAVVSLSLTHRAFLGLAVVRIALTVAFAIVSLANWSVSNPVAMGGYVVNLVAMSVALPCFWNMPIRHESLKSDEIGYGYSVS